MPSEGYHICEFPQPKAKRCIMLKKSHAGKEYMIKSCIAKDSGLWFQASFWYPKSTWSPEQARKHCDTHKVKGKKGRFMVAKKKSETRIDPLGKYADYINHAFPMQGEHLIHSHNALHHQWQAKPENRFGVCERYEERDFIITHTLLVAEIRRRGLEHRYEDDLDHRLPLSLKRGSDGYEGEVVTDYIVDTCGEVVATSVTEANKELIDQISTAKGADLKKLTEGDEAPFFVVVRAMRVGISGNRRKYSKEILQKFQGLHPMPGYESHRHIDKPEFGQHPEMFHPVTAWIGALLKEDELYSKGYIPKGQKQLKETIELAHAIGKPMVVSITGKVEQILKKDEDGEFWEIQDITDGTIDWYQPTATPGIPGAGSIDFRKSKSTANRR